MTLVESNEMFMPFSSGPISPNLLNALVQAHICIAVFVKMHHILSTQHQQNTPTELNKLDLFGQPNENLIEMEKHFD